MAGYDQAKGMSRNAVTAYEENLKPLSKVTAGDLKNADIKISLALARWMAKNGHWRPSEWHHSSKFYNEVDFYNTADLHNILQSMPEGRLERFRQVYKESRQAERIQKQTRTPVKGRYAVWSTGRTKQIQRWQDFTGMLDERGWIHLPDNSRKKASSTNLSYETSTLEENERIERNREEREVAKADRKKKAQVKTEAKVAEARALEIARDRTQAHRPAQFPDVPEIKDEDPCAKCNASLESIQINKRVKPSQTFYMAWNLKCTNLECARIYTTKRAVRLVLRGRDASNCDHPEQQRCQCPRCSERNQSWATQEAQQK